MKAKINRGVLAGGIDSHTFHSFEALKYWVEQFGRDNLYNVVEMYQGCGTKGAEEYRSLCKKFGLKTIYIPGVPLKLQNLDLSSTNEEVRCKAVQAVQKGIDDAYAFGAFKCLLICGGPVQQNADEQECYQRLFQSLCEIFQYVKEEEGEYGYSMRIGMEPFSREREPYFFLGPTDLTLRLLKKLEELGYCLEITYDLAHYYLLEEDVVESFRKLMPYITHIHLSNCVMGHPENPLEGDKHPLFGVPDSCVDEEVLNWWMQAVVKSGFFEQKEEVTISYEVITGKDQIPMEVYKESNEVYERVLKNADLLGKRGA